jgi:hypothetical protein
MAEIKDFHYRVEVIFQITRPEMDYMIRCSERHYDYKCQVASKVGGFLYGWSNYLRMMEEDGKDHIETAVDMHTMDTLCKILEAARKSDPDDHGCWLKCCQTLSRMGREYERINKQSLANLADDPLDSWLDEHERTQALIDEGEGRRDHAALKHERLGED